MTLPALDWESSPETGDGCAGFAYCLPDGDGQQAEPWRCVRLKAVMDIPHDLRDLKELQRNPDPVRPEQPAPNLLAQRMGMVLQDGLDPDADLLYLAASIHDPEPRGCVQFYGAVGRGPDPDRARVQADAGLHALESRLDVMLSIPLQYVSASLLQGMMRQLEVLPCMLRSGPQLMEGGDLALDAPAA